MWFYCQLKEHSSVWNPSCLDEGLEEKPHSLGCGYTISVFSSAMQHHGACVSPSAALSLGRGEDSTKTQWGLAGRNDDTWRKPNLVALGSQVTLSIPMQEKQVIFFKFAGNTLPVQAQPAAQIHTDRVLSLYWHPDKYTHHLYKYGKKEVSQPWMSFPTDQTENSLLVCIHLHPLHSQNPTHSLKY